MQTGFVIIDLSYQRSSKYKVITKKYNTSHTIKFNASQINRIGCKQVLLVSGDVLYDNSLENGLRTLDSIFILFSQLLMHLLYTFVLSHILDVQLEIRLEIFTRQISK